MIRRKAYRGRLVWSFVVSSLVSLVPAGCVGPGTERSPFDRQAGPADVVILRVENRNLHEVTIFLRNGGRRQEIGTVDARGVEFLNLPWSPGRPVSLELELIVGERYRLPPYLFTGAGRVELIIAPELRRSTLRG